MDVFRAVLLCFHVFTAIQASGEHHSLSVTVPHRTYECPEGADVILKCVPSGSKAYPQDTFWTTWLYTPRSKDHCQKGAHPRKANRTNHSLGVEYFRGDKVFSVSLKNIKHTDQGKYCCWILDLHGKHKEQDAHDFMYLTVVPTPADARNGSLKCLEYSHTASDDSVAEGLAIAACVAFVLCLPLILMLVYRQRQTVDRHRRAQELVRMDSEAQAHENPVFLGDSPEPKMRTVSQIIMRQSSETGHHLLSEPGTPFSPNIQGELFFPAQDPIPESSNLLG